jgi:hypothetical protein
MASFWTIKLRDAIFKSDSLKTERMERRRSVIRKKATKQNQHGDVMKTTPSKYIAYVTIYPLTIRKLSIILSQTSFRFFFTTINRFPFRRCSVLNTYPSSRSSDKKLSATFELEEHAQKSRNLSQVIVIWRLPKTDAA